MTGSTFLEDLGLSIHFPKFKRHVIFVVKSVRLK